MKSKAEELLSNFTNDSSNISDIYFWSVFRKGAHPRISYSLKQVETNELDENFKEMLNVFFEGNGNGYVKLLQENLSEYKPISATLTEDSALFNSIDSTIESIIKLVKSGSDIHSIKKMEELKGCWIYIIEYKIQGSESRYYGFSKTRGDWSLRDKNFIKIAFTTGRFEKVENPNIFTLNQTFDFVVGNGVNVIRNKAAYELMLNIRDTIVKEIGNGISDIASVEIVDIDSLKMAIGENKLYARKLKQVVDKSYYKDPEFIKTMKTVIQDRGYNFPTDSNGKFIIDKANVKEFLTLLEDYRMESLIRHKVHDAEVAKPL